MLIMQRVIVTCLRIILTFELFILLKFINIHVKTNCHNVWKSNHFVATPSFVQNWILTIIAVILICNKIMLNCKWFNKWWRHNPKKKKTIEIVKKQRTWSTLKSKLVWRCSCSQTNACIKYIYIMWKCNMLSKRFRLKCTLCLLCMARTLS